MNTDRENQHGENWEDSRPFWYLSFDFGSIFDKIKKYIERRKLRAILKGRVKRFNDSKSGNRD